MYRHCFALLIALFKCDCQFSLLSSITPRYFALDPIGTLLFLIISLFGRYLTMLVASEIMISLVFSALNDNPIFFHHDFKLFTTFSILLMIYSLLLPLFIQRDFI